MISLTRRTALLSSLAAMAAGGACSPAFASAPAKADRFVTGIEALEAKAGGHLGVAMLFAGGQVRGHRLHERFALCSTFKLPLAAMVLWAADHGQISLTERIPYTERDLVGNSPITLARVAEGALSLSDLAHAAQVESDNTAGEILLRRMGGPQKLTAWLASIGDSTTRLDHYLDQLHLSGSADETDSTTPEAMARTILLLLTGDTLAPASQATLLAWMRATRTGPRRLRAGLPSAWAMGHKTGTGSEAGKPNQYNDIAIAFPPGQPPLALAVYYQGPGHFKESRPEDEAVLAKVGSLAGRLA